MVERLSGKTAIVTGAASGIGRATALRLASEGAVVAGVDLAADAAGQTATSINEAGGQGLAYGCDVADPDSVRDTVARAVVDLGGRIDVLCNIAGIGKFAHSHTQPLAEWDKILAVNLTGTFVMCQAVLPYLLEQGSGTILNTASTAGIMAQPYSAAYCASKGGVVLLTKALAAEYVERGIRVNAVAPGGVDTPIIKNFGYPEGASAKLFYKLISPMGFCQAEEIAAAFAYLASDETRYMTGTVLTIDGGMTA